MIPANADSVPDVVGHVRVSAGTFAAATIQTPSASASVFAPAPLPGALRFGDLGRTRIAHETRLRAAERAAGVTLAAGALVRA